MSVILVGVDDSERSADAVAFAHAIARDTGARVLVASTFPYDDIPSRAANLEYREAVESAAGHVARDHAHALSDLGDRVSTATVARTSPAHGLHDLAVSADAALTVVGSTHTGRSERVVAGSTAERLLHGAPCAVAVVPREYRHTRPQLRTIGVAWDGSAEADTALNAAVALARALRARVRVIRVVGEDHAELAAAADLVATVSHLAALAEANATLLVGDPVDELGKQTEELDLLVTGSRGYGPLHATLIGGVTGRVLRAAACPVIVVPRGVEAPLAGLFPAGPRLRRDQRVAADTASRRSRR
jgi:nucleotide-binding universal stress UspA family protein